MNNTPRTFGWYIGGVVLGALGGLFAAASVGVVVVAALGMGFLAAGFGRLITAS